MERFALQRLTPIPGVARILTILTLSEVKSTTVLPLETSGKATSDQTSQVEEDL